ncbi:MAG TPA: PPC domain-containing DNA-binding protein [Methanomassiliicoccales archaeon]|nr:PPC domain-containing DNA-binding protein [Methanomassiliicoccales archaeon]
MKHKNAENVMIIKLDDGEDVHESLLSACEKNDIRMGWVHSGIGILRNFTIGYYTRGGYLKRTFEEPYELLSLTGTVTLDAEVPIHLHASLAGRNYEVVGGHLFGGTVTNLNEILVTKMPGEIWMGRTLNPATEYYELDIK